MAKKKVSRFVAVLVALVMALSIVALPVMAIPVTGADGLYITKHLRMPYGTRTPASTFTFNVTQVDLNGTAVATTTPGLTLPGPYTINFTAGQAATVTVPPAPTGNVHVVGTAALNLNVANFPHAGIFGFEIREQANTNPALDADPLIYLNYSQAVYRMEVHINYSASDVRQIGFVTFHRLTNDDGTAEPTPQKVDARDGGLLFTNRYVMTYDPGTDPQANAALWVGKTVCTNGNRTTPHNFTINFTLPNLLPGTHAAAVGPFQARIYEGATPVGAQFTIPVSGTTNFALAHGQRLYIAGVPIGTTFNLTEAGNTLYNQAATVVQGGGTPTAGHAIIGPTSTGSPLDNANDLTVSNGLVSNATNRTNSVSVTNTFNFSPPMGVLLNNLPFIGLVLLSVVALAGVAALKIRKSKNEAY